MNLDKQLIEALEKSDRKAVEKLLLGGANPNAKKGKKLALDLVPHRQDEIKCLLLEAGGWSKKIRGSLVWAAGLGRPATVKAMLAKGSDPNTRAPLGTPIKVAAEKGDLETVRVLLEAGADPDAGGGWATALTAAVTTRNQSLLELLLQAGASTEATGDYDDASPLALAAAMGEKRVVELLLFHGAEVDRVCRQVAVDRFQGPVGGPQTTALILASSLGHAEIVQLLLEAGADPHLRDGEGNSAVALASGAVSQVFAQRGVEVPQVSAEDRLLQACEKVVVGEVQELLRQGVEVNCRDQRQGHSGWTPLMWSAWNGSTEMVELLLKAAADTRLAEEGNAQAIKFLASEGDTENIREQMQLTLGRDALMLALERGHDNCARLLVDASAPAFKDFASHTALTLAAQNGALETVTALLEQGRDHKQKGPGGRNSLILACENGHSEVAGRLLQEKWTKPQLSKALVEAAGDCNLPLVSMLIQSGAGVKAKSRSRGLSWPLSRRPAGLPPSQEHRALWPPCLAMPG